MAYAPVMPVCLSNEFQFTLHQGKVNIRGISSWGISGAWNISYLEIEIADWAHLEKMARAISD